MQRPGIPFSQEDDDCDYGDKDDEYVDDDDDGEVDDDGGGRQPFPG